MTRVNGVAQCPEKPRSRSIKPRASVLPPHCKGSGDALRAPSRDLVGNYPVSTLIDNRIIIRPIQVMGGIHGHK